jgi:membrane-associated protein
MMKATFATVLAPPCEVVVQRKRRPGAPSGYLPDGAEVNASNGRRFSLRLEGEKPLVITTVIDLFGPLFSGLAGYLVIVGLIFLDRGAFTGVALPGEVILALGGVYAARGDLSIGLVILVGALAGLLGEVVSYWLGRVYGLRIVRHLPLANRFEKHLDEANDYFRHHGGTTVFVGRYISVVGTFLPFAAGMSDMPFRRFLTFDVAAIVLWSAGVSLLGYFLNSQIQLVDRVLSQVGWGLLALVALVVVGRLIWKRRKDVRKKVAEWRPSS